MKYDVIIVGAGPAGIFTAIEMIQKKSQKKILIIEKAALSRSGNAPSPSQRNVLAASLLAISHRAFPVQARSQMESFR